MSRQLEFDNDRTFDHGSPPFPHPSGGMAIDRMPQVVRIRLAEDGSVRIRKNGLRPFVVI